MKMEKETSGPKNPNVTVKKSALEEFLEEWGSWRGKSKAKKMERDSHIAQPHGKPRKKKPFADSNTFLVIKMIAGLIDFIVSGIMFMFSFVFSFKFWIIVGVIIYFSDIDIKTKVLKAVGEQKMEETIQQLDEGAGKLSEQIESNSERINKAINGWKEQLDGISIDIKKKDGTTIHYDGADLDVWTSDPKEPEVEKTE